MGAGPGSCLPNSIPTGPCCGCRSGWRSSRPGGSIRRGWPSADLIHVEARDAKAALWAMEEGLRCAAIGAVIGEMWGDPGGAGLHRDAATGGRGRAAWRGGMADSAGRPRQSERGAEALAGGERPSLPHPLDPRAPGAAAWDAELFRARGRSAGALDGDVMRTADFHLVAAAGDRALGEAGLSARRMTRVALIEEGRTVNWCMQ